MILKNRRKLEMQGHQLSYDIERLQNKIDKIKFKVEKDLAIKQIYVKQMDDLVKKYNKILEELGTA